MKLLNMLVVALIIFLLCYFVIAPYVIPMLAGKIYSPGQEFGYTVIIEIALVSGVVIGLLAEIYFKLEELSKKLSGKQNEESSDCGSGDDN